MRSALAAEVKFREVWAWSMYDFANSAYTTVVITAVFGAYFVSAVAGNADVREAVHLAYGDRSRGPRRCRRRTRRSCSPVR